MIIDLQKWMSRKLGALILLVVFCFETPNFDNIWVIITKVAIVGGATVIYTICQAMQNIAMMEILHKEPTDNGTNGDTTNKSVSSCNYPTM